jgi:hypothetical protein
VTGVFGFAVVDFSGLIGGGVSLSGLQSDNVARQSAGRGVARAGLGP